MKKKLIKKYLNGGPTRLYTYGPLPSKDKWNGITTITDIFGNDLSPGDLVMATPEGKMVTKDNTQAYLDYLAANNIPIEGPTLLDLTVQYNPKSDETNVTVGLDFDTRLANTSAAPTAEELRQLGRLTYLQTLPDNSEIIWNQSKDKHTIDVNLADKKAKELTPGFWTFTSPMWLGVAGILGFESVSAMAAFASAYPQVFSSIIGSTIAGESLNEIVKLGSKGQYQSWGDLMNLHVGHGDKSSELEKFLWELTNLGYMADPLSLTILPIKQFGKLAFNKTAQLLNGPWAQRTLNTANKYNLGEGVKAGIYNTALSLLYGPEVAAKAGLNHLKLKAQDVGWYTRNFFTKDALNAWRDMYQNYEFVKFNPKAFKPSDRTTAKQFFDTKVSAAKYAVNDVSPNFSIQGTKYATARGSGLKLIKTPIKFVYYPKASNKNNFRFLDPQAAKKLLVYDWGFNDWDAESILTGEAGKILEGPLLDKYYPLVVGGLADIHNPNKVLSAEALEVNTILGDLGHVTGSLVTVLNPYATHTPKDVDIITTDRNLPEVLKRLNLTVVKDDGWHVVANSPKYGDMDIQIIQHSTNGSKGRIAFLTYAKMDPLAYNDMLRSGVYEVPLSPDELLDAHRDNVLHFSNLDSLVSGSKKHAERIRNLLLSPDKNIIRLAINDLENVYRAHLGKDFFPLEELGVHIDYNNIDANIEFLKKFGLLNPEYLAKNPDKMEFLIKYLLYRTHIANRTIEKTSAMDALDVVRAILTNASYSNYGGNASAGKFGGGIQYYGGADPYIGNILYPVNHPEKLKNAMDLYNYLGKMIDVEEVWKGQSRGWGREAPLVNTELLENFYHDFPIPLDVSRLLQNTLHFLNFLTGKERLFDILHHIVPNRNPELNISNVKGNSLEREVLSDINDTVGKTLDISHVFSFLPGFDNAFFGKLLKDIPNLRYNIVRGSDANGTYFNGFELPRVSLEIPKGRSIQMNPTHTFNPRMWKSNAVKKGQLNANRKVHRAMITSNKMSLALGNLYSVPLSNIDVAKGILKASSVPLTIGGLLGGIWYMNRDRPSYHFYHNIWNKVPYGLYGKTPEQIQKQLAYVGIVLDNNDLQLINFSSEEDFYNTLEELLVNKYDK